MNLIYWFSFCETCAIHKYSPYSLFQKSPSGQWFYGSYDVKIIHIEKKTVFSKCIFVLLFYETLRITFPLTKGTRRLPGPSETLILCIFYFWVMIYLLKSFAASIKSVEVLLWNDVTIKNKIQTFFFFFIYQKQL